MSKPDSCCYGCAWLCIHTHKKVEVHGFDRCTPANSVAIMYDTQHMLPFAPHGFGTQKLQSVLSAGLSRGMSRS